MIRAGKCLVLLSSGVGIGTAIERMRRKEASNLENSELDNGTRFLWPTVSAKSVVPVGSSALAPTVSRSGEIMKYGFPGLDNIRTFEDYVVSYDRKNRNPHWVFEHLTRDRLQPGENVKREGSTFFEDKSMHEFFRATNDDYKKSGYDRGHLAAAANHRYSQSAMDQTFVLTNIAPQVGKGFNRDAWNTLEKFVRHLTKTYINVYVCSGPLYLPRCENRKKTVS